MKNFLVVVLFLFSKITFGQVLKGIKIYYHDNQTVKGMDVYREFKDIGESPFWSKPEKLDVVLTFNKTTSTDNDIEVIIEELFEPTPLSNKVNKGILHKRWVPHQVVFSGNTNFIREGKITVKNIAYQTAYFTDNLLFKKMVLE